MRAIRNVTILSLFLFLLTSGAPAQAQPDGPPRVSPLASVSQTVGISSIEITYSRPYVKGRTIYGDLVPYDAVWRTGANEATTFEISDDATVEGKKLPAGKYALFTVPGKDSWTIIFNDEANQWGSMRHDTAKDALRVEVKPQSVPATEMLTAAIRDVTADSAEVHLHWAETGVHFTVAFDTPEIAIARARMDAKDPEKARLMRSWADYFRQENKYVDEALAWQTKIADQDPSYWNLSLQARLQAANGNEAAAAATAEKAVMAGRKALEENPNDFMQGDLEALEEESEGWGE